MQLGSVKLQGGIKVQSWKLVVAQLLSTQEPESITRSTSGRLNACLRVLLPNSKDMFALSCQSISLSRVVQERGTWEETKEAKATISEDERGKL